MKRLPLLLLPFVFSACYSLAQDITPPPGYVYTTPVPSAVPTEAMYFPFMPPDPDSGAAIFAEKCEPCHGSAGFGDGPSAVELPNPVAPIGDLELAQQRTPEDWYSQVTEGNLENYMPPFNSLTDRQRWDVVAYAFNLSVTPEMLALGEGLYSDNCTACHGVSGAGDGPAAITLPSAPNSLTDQAMMAERSLDDLASGMTHPDAVNLPHFDAELSAAERLALAIYVRSLTYASSGQIAGESEPAATSSAPGSAGAAPTVPASQDPNATPDGQATEPAANTGVVSGEIVNASSGETPAGLEVTLYGFDEFQQVMTETVTTDAAGEFLFDAVEMPEGRAFIVSVDYQRATYTSDLAVAGPEPQDIVLQVTVFESSTDASSLSIDRLHVFFEFLSADTVRVAELILVTNPTDLVIISAEEGQATLEFQLPSEAQNLQFQEGALGTQFIETESGFGDLRAIQPGIGSHQILFSFDLPYSRNFRLDQSLTIPVSALVVMVPQVGVEMVSDSLVSAGAGEIEGQPVPYELFTGGGVAVGQQLPIGLSGTPRFDGAAGGGSKSGLAIGMTALGGALVLAGFWLFRRRRTQTTIEDLELDEPLPEHVSEMSVEELIDSIISLDDQFKSGDLPEGAYHKRRSLLKGRLQEMME